MKAILPSLIICLAIVACDGFTPRDRMIAKYDLDAKKVEIMDAYIEGLKQEGKGPLIGHTTFESGAACYANQVRISDRLHEVNLEYTRNYMEAERDLYAWFRARGYSQKDADDIYERAGVATTYCKEHP